MIKREPARFILVGGTTDLVDYITYLWLVEFHIISPQLAKTVAFLNGTLFSYFANRNWTFSSNQHRSGSAGRFLVLYGSTLCANIFVNSLALNSLGNLHLAFALATAISATANFFGMKFFVFQSTSN